MPPDSQSEVSSIIVISNMALSDTELTLALPGHGHDNINGGFRSSTKRGFVETVAQDHHVNDKLEDQVSINADAAGIKAPAPK